MATVNAFINELIRSGLRIRIVNDKRGIVPGGFLEIDLILSRVNSTSLLIKSVHPIGERFENPECYSITEITIDSSDVIRKRQPISASDLCTTVLQIIRRRFDARTQRNRGPRSFRHQRPSNLANRTARGHFSIKHQASM